MVTNRNYLETVEERILELSSKAQSGAPCKIGDHIFTILYTKDTWEWVFKGNYYFDIKDLAEAILEDEAVLEAI